MQEGKRGQQAARRYRTSANIGNVREDGMCGMETGCSESLKQAGSMCVQWEAYEMDRHMQH